MKKKPRTWMPFAFTPTMKKNSHDYTVSLVEVGGKYDHIFYNRNTNDWWFSDEAADLNGPYDTIDKAASELKLYAEHILG